MFALVLMLMLMECSGGKKLNVKGSEVAARLSVRTKTHKSEQGRQVLRRDAIGAGRKWVDLRPWTVAGGWVVPAPGRAGLTSGKYHIS